MKKVFEKIVEGIQIIEKEFLGHPSEVKKQKAVELINKMIDIPVIPEFLEAQVFGIVIDLVVYLFNKYNLWPKEGGEM